MNIEPHEIKEYADSLTKERAYEIGCKDSFAEVLHNTDDQVTVRNILMMIPVDIQIKVCDHYNQERIKRAIRSENPSVD